MITHPPETLLDIAIYRRIIGDSEGLLIQDESDEEEEDNAMPAIRDKGKGKERVVNRPVTTSSEKAISEEWSSPENSIAFFEFGRSDLVSFLEPS